jgi:hypothetical protein
MKLRTIILVALASMHPLSAAELERIAPGSHIGIAAQLVATAVKKDPAASTSAPALSTRTVAGGVRNYGTAPAEVEICTLWFGKEVPTAQSGKGPANNRIVLKRVKTTETLAAGQTFAVNAEISDMAACMFRVPIGEHTIAAARIEGWAIVARDAKGALLAVKASDPALETVIRTAGALDALPRIEFVGGKPEKDSDRKFLSSTTTTKNKFVSATSTSVKADGSHQVHVWSYAAGSQQ